MAAYTPPTLSALTDSVGSLNAPFNRATSPHSTLSHTGSHRSRTPSVEGPRLSFNTLSRGELPSIVIPENRDRRRILLGTYAVLFTRYCIATFLSAFFGSDTTAWGMTGTWNGLIFAGYPLGMALTSLFAPQVCPRSLSRLASHAALHPPAAAAAACPPPPEPRLPTPPPFPRWSRASAPAPRSSLVSRRPPC